MGRSDDGSRLNAGYWTPFNLWWRSYLDINGGRPKAEDIKRWHEEEAHRAFPSDPPSYTLLCNHAKGLRDSTAARSYFRHYRARKRKEVGSESASEGKGGGAGCSSNGSSDHDSDADAGAAADPSDEDWSESEVPRRKRQRREPRRPCDRQTAKPRQAQRAQAGAVQLSATAHMEYQHERPAPLSDGLQPQPQVQVQLREGMCPESLEDVFSAGATEPVVTATITLTTGSPAGMLVDKRCGGVYSCPTELTASYKAQEQQQQRRQPATQQRRVQECLPDQLLLPQPPPPPSVRRLSSTQRTATTPSGGQSPIIAARPPSMAGNRLVCCPMSSASGSGGAASDARSGSCPAPVRPARTPPPPSPSPTPSPAAPATAMAATAPTSRLAGHAVTGCAESAGAMADLVMPASAAGGASLDGAGGRVGRAPMGSAAGAAALGPQVSRAPSPVAAAVHWRLRTQRPPCLTVETATPRLGRWSEAGPASGQGAKVGPSKWSPGCMRLAAVPEAAAADGATGDGLTAQEAGRQASPAADSLCQGAAAEGCRDTRRGMGPVTEPQQVGWVGGSQAPLAATGGALDLRTEAVPPLMALPSASIERSASGSGLESGPAGRPSQPWTPFALPASGAAAAAMAAELRPPVTTVGPGWRLAGAPEAAQTPSPASPATPARPFASLPPGIGLGGRHGNTDFGSLDGPPSVPQPQPSALSPLPLQRAAASAPLGTVAADGGGFAAVADGPPPWQRRGRSRLRVASLPTPMSLGAGRSGSMPLPMSTSVSTAMPMSISLASEAAQLPMDTVAAAGAHSGGYGLSEPDFHVGRQWSLPNGLLSRQEGGLVGGLGPEQRRNSLPPVQVSASAQAPSPAAPAATGPPPVTTGFSRSKGLARAPAAPAAGGAAGASYEAMLDSGSGGGAQPTPLRAPAAARVVLTGAQLGETAPQHNGAGEPSAGPVLDGEHLGQGSEGVPLSWPTDAAAPPDWSSMGSQLLPFPSVGLAHAQSGPVPSGAAMAAMPYGWPPPQPPQPFGRVRRLPLRAAPWAYPPPHPHHHPHYIPYPYPYPPPVDYAASGEGGPTAAAAPQPRYMPYAARRRYPPPLPPSFRHVPPPPYAHSHPDAGPGGSPSGFCPGRILDGNQYLQLPAGGDGGAGGGLPPGVMAAPPLHPGGRGAAMQLLSQEPWSHPGYEDLRPSLPMPYPEPNGAVGGEPSAGSNADPSPAPGPVGAHAAAERPATAKIGGGQAEHPVGHDNGASVAGGGNAVAGSGGGESAGGRCIIEEVWALCAAADGDGGMEG